jgi:hypothetical protein
MMQRSCFLFLFSFLCCNPLSAQQIKSPEGFMLKLSEEQATKFAGLALKNIHREYPSKEYHQRKFVSRSCVLSET